MKVDLPHPRQRKELKFLDVVDRVYMILAGQTMPEYLELGTAPGEPGRTRGLPQITINDLAGLLEHLDAMPNNRADIYPLAHELQINSDDLLRLIEAAELLGFATIAHGDITLNPLGETFAEASIRARKEIFAMRLKRLPIFRWLLALLRAADKKQLEWDVVQTALELEFHEEEAERQLETAINWGRYAEILAYDDSSEVLYLEPTGS
jgi:NitT/TauT family transport system ATP-binding protein